MNCKIIYFVLLCYYVSLSNSNLQEGPDPWHHEELKAPPTLKDENILPADLRTPIQKVKQSETKFVFGEWWFKRLLAIVLKSGQVKKSNEDGSVDVSLQMRFEEDRWKELEDCLKSESTLSDVMFRRTVGYIEEGIYKPTITDKIAMAWSDYILVYITAYKTNISWVLGTLGGLGILLWLWQHMSHKHIITLIFAFSYIYEIFISYKEAEQQEYERFLSALNKCKWNIWRWIDDSECTLPSPDPLSFLKYMNPLKIAIRMFTYLISEPIIALNSTIKIILNDITDGLWWPLDKLVYGALIVIISISLIYLLVIIVFNFILNIPFSLNFLGILSIGVKQSRRSLFSNSNNNNERNTTADTDRISGDRLDKLLNVFTLALNVNGNREQKRLSNNEPVIHNTGLPKLQRSASTGRLPTLRSAELNYDSKLMINNDVRKRYIQGRGEGDH